MLESELGEAYERRAFVSRPPEEEGARAGGRSPGDITASARPKRMYMPVLHGARGSSVRTRVVIFHWHEGDEVPDPIEVRADLLALDGRRLGIWSGSVAPHASAVIDVAGIPGVGDLQDGVGTLKLVVSADRVGSLRPYFHFISDGGVTSTHEKSSPRKDSEKAHRRDYHWIFPVGASPRPSEAFFYCVNAVTYPIEGRSLAWNGADGDRAAVDLPDLELDQGAMVPLHDHFEAIRAGGRAGTVRLTPTAHVAGHMIRYEPQEDRWRVQHL